MPATVGFAPITGPSARALILGTLPSQKSLETDQYYGHPRNVFWSIMGELVGAGPNFSYVRRTELLINRRLAVWDVLACSVRPGSMDSAIEQSTARANDFDSFLNRHAELQLICFNGQAAAALFRKLVVSRNPRTMEGLRFATLPSTSPAYAAMRYAEKLKQWSHALASVITAE